MRPRFSCDGPRWSPGNGRSRRLHLGKQGRRLPCERSETVSTSDGLFDLRMWFVGSRFWVLGAASTHGETIYPRYFMDSFKLK